MCPLVLFDGQDGFVFPFFFFASGELLQIYTGVIKDRSYPDITKGLFLTRDKILLLELHRGALWDIPHLFVIHFFPLMPMRRPCTQLNPLAYTGVAAELVWFFSVRLPRESTPLAHCRAFALNHTGQFGWLGTGGAWLRCAIS